MRAGTPLVSNLRPRMVVPSFPVLLPSFVALHMMLTQRCAGSRPRALRRHPDAKPAGMVMPPPPPEMRGRYHVDPRGVCSPWVAYEARLGEGAMGRAARAPPPYSVGF